MKPVIEDIAKALSDAGLAPEEAPFKGASVNDILKIENRFSVTLPATYKQFLLTMGRQMGHFLRDFVVTYPQIIFHYDSVVRILAGNQVTLPKTAFVFATTDSDGLYFFDTAKGTEDPPVFLIAEDEAEQVYDSFSEWLRQLAKEDIESWMDPDSGVKESLAKHDAEPAFQQRQTKLSQSKFQIGNPVQVARDCSNVDTQLGDASKVNLKTGEVGTVFYVRWLKDSNQYDYFVEFTDESGTKLLGLCVLAQDSLETASVSGAACSS